MCVCVCVRSAEFQKQVISEFRILHLCHMEMLLETFHENRMNSSCTGTHIRILLHYGL